MISNATPLIFLAKLNELGLLQKLFGIITIPEAVKKEIFIEGKQGFFSLQMMMQKGMLQIKNPAIRLPLGLGEGETSAISLAKETKDRILMDDTPAAQRAQEFGIETIRTTTIIFHAYKKGMINKDKALSLLNQLIDNGYYITTAQYTKLIEKLKK